MLEIMAFLSSTAFIDLIIAFLILETAVICIVNNRTNSLRLVVPIARNAAGICLLFALRFAVADAAQFWILLSLSGALLAHLVDLKTLAPTAIANASPTPKGMP